MIQRILDNFIRNRIKHFMCLENISPYQLATACELPRTTLYRYLKGDGAVDISVVEALCNLLCISQTEFYAPYDATHTFDDTPVAMVAYEWNNKSLNRANAIYEQKKGIYDKSQQLVSNVKDK